MPKHLIVRGPGLRGPAGRNGLDGVNAVPADEFVAGLVEDETSETRAALDLLVPTVPNATTTTKGIVELATSAETTAGTDSTRAVTPAGLKAVTDALPSGGGGGTLPLIGLTEFDYSAYGGAIAAPYSVDGGGYPVLVALAGGGRNVTFIAPDSGTVVVQLGGVVGDTGYGRGSYFWGLLDHTSGTQRGERIQVSYNDEDPTDPYGTRQFRTAQVVVDGLTGGQSYTFDWAHAKDVNSGTVELLIGNADSVYTSAVMMVYGLGGSEGDVDLSDYAQKNATQNISGAWDFDVAPTVNGDPIGSGGGAADLNLLAPPILGRVDALYHGGSSIPTAPRSAPEMLFGKSDSAGRSPLGVFGSMITAVKTFGAGGNDTIDALGRYDIMDLFPLVPSLLYCDTMTNDLVKLAGIGTVPTSDQVIRYKNSMRAIIARLMSQGLAVSDNAMFNYSGGTWVAQTSDSPSVGGFVTVGTGFYAGTKRRYTATLNDEMTWVVGAGQETTWVLLSGVDAATAGYTGATYSISGAGLGAPVTGTTNNKISRSGSFHADTATIAIKLTGLTVGGTLTLKKTDANGSRLGFEGFCNPKTNPGVVIFVKGYPSGQDATGQAMFADALDEVIAEFDVPDQVLLTLDPTALGYGAGMNADSLHPNAKGHTFIRNALWEVLAGITEFQGEAIQ